MAESKKAEREFVVLNAFEHYSDDALVEVQERLEMEAEAVLAEIAAENQRRSEAAITAALARAQRSGVTVNVPTDGKAPAKRGRKPKQTSAAPVANGHADDQEGETLDAE